MLKHIPSRFHIFTPYTSCWNYYHYEAYIYITWVLATSNVLSCRTINQHFKPNKIGHNSYIILLPIIIDTLPAIAGQDQLLLWSSFSPPQITLLIQQVFTCKRLPSDFKYLNWLANYSPVRNSSTLNHWDKHSCGVKHAHQLFYFLKYFSSHTISMMRFTCIQLIINRSYSSWSTGHLKVITLWGPFKHTGLYWVQTLWHDTPICIH